MSLLIDNLIVLVFGGIAIGTGILSSISEFSAFGIVALEPIVLQNYRVIEGYIKKKIQYSPFFIILLLIVASETEL
jgi:hypothetical protein